MNRALDPSKMDTVPKRSKNIRQEAGEYIRNRRVFSDVRQAYLDNRITQQEFRTLYGQVRAGDADGAVKGLARLTRR